EPILDDKGTLIQTIGTVQDVTDQKMSEQKIFHMAHHDALTDLPNRALFYDRLKTGLKTARREKRQLAVLFLDLDGFKAINDNDGHQVGDMLLIGVAQRLVGCVRDTDTVGRMGGDEFAIILGGDVTHDHVIMVTKKILTSISEPFDLMGENRSIGTSIGVSLYPQHGDDSEVLLNKADEAMYHVKNTGKNGYFLAV
ncbi:MAG: GGDEF domain-containing protein, partial [Rhodospirillales bacterium]|nr:GGDEF domain-containing protein [Rhodospirillales bacterium]